MAETVGDHVLQRLREWGVEQVFAYPGDGINGIVAAFGKADDSPRVHPGAARGDVARCRPSGTPSSPARSASAWPRPARARSTCSTASTTRSSTTSPSSRSSGRPSAARWAAPTSRRSTCRRCSRTWPASTSSRSTSPSSCPLAIDRAIRTALSRRAPDGGHHPERPADRAVQPAEARVQAGPVQPAAAARADRRRPTPPNRPRRRGPQCRAAGRDPGRTGRARCGGRGRSRSRTSSARASRRRCSARTC